MTVFGHIFPFSVYTSQKLTDDYFFVTMIVFVYSKLRKNCPCQSFCKYTIFSRTLIRCLQNRPYRNGNRAMTHVAVPPAVVLATATAVAPRRRRLRAQMKALNLFYPSAARNWCQGGIKAFRLATLSGTARVHQIRTAADKMVAKTTF